MDEASERQAIERTVEIIARVAGARPLGWHTRSATSPRTRDLLIEEGGFLYDSNAYNDDLPYTVETALYRMGARGRRERLRVHCACGWLDRRTVPDRPGQYVRLPFRDRRLAGAARGGGVRP